MRVSAIQALGWACAEKIGYTDGFIPREQFLNFDIFAPSEIPRIEIKFMQNDSGDAKGIGDLPFSCIPAAYVQAVSQAVNRVFRTVPLRVSDIWAEGLL
jgi:CO/xanthine dehydrogenase Mo-binding subunit